MTDTSCAIEPLAPFRQFVIDGMSLGAHKPCIHGLVEVDITVPRERIRQIKEQRSETILFTGFIIYCCARAVDEERHVHIWRDWCNRLVMFDDEAAYVIIEMTVDHFAIEERRVACEREALLARYDRLEVPARDFIRKVFCGA